MNTVIARHRSKYEEILTKISIYTTDIQSITKQKTEDAIYWNNDFLPGLDIIMLYVMLAERQPRHYFEVGSGFSTILAHHVKQKHSPHTIIHSIDPNPRTFIDKCADELIRKPFESLDLSSLDIQSGDILFIDNSHRILPNSDAMVFFMELLPFLPTGVIVHLHDIYLPYDYPQFMCDRFYNEQYGLAAFLLANPDRYKTIMPNYYISQDTELSSIYSSIWKHENLSGVERHGGSYWIEIGG